MSPTTLRPLRARNAEEKKKRRQEILRAAEHLWQDTPYQELSMNQVAREAKLAKGTLYLYFDTKEELFLALLGDHLGQWLQELTTQIQAAPPQSADECADLFIRLGHDQQPLLRLLVLWTTVIQPGVPENIRFDFRRQMLRLVLPLLDTLPFDRQVNLRMLMHLYAAAVGWHLVDKSSQDIGPQPLLPLSLEAGTSPTFDMEFPVACRAAIYAVTRQSLAARS